MRKERRILTYFLIFNFFFSEFFFFQAPLLSISTLFGDLGENPQVVKLVSKYLKEMYELGTRKALQLLYEENKL